MQLTSTQRKQIAAIAAGAGNIFLASVFLPYFLETFEPGLALLGLIEALAIWTFSVIFINKDGLQH